MPSLSSNAFFPLTALVLALCTPLASADITRVLFPNTAFGPASAASSTVVPVPSAVGFPAFSSARFEGSVSVPRAQLVNFTIRTDGSVRLWVDDHLILDDDEITAPRTVQPLLAYAFTTTAPLPFRLEYARGDGTAGAATLEVSWSGNFTNAAVVPAAAFSTTTAPSHALRQALRDRQLAPAVQWQTYDNPTMGAHVRMPQAFSLDATLADTAGAGEVLGDVIVYRRAHPAITYVGAHSYNGSDFTELRIDAWGGRACTVTFVTTVVAGGADLLFLASANGTGCATLALLVRPRMLWSRAGSFAATAPGELTASAPGFPDTVVYAVGATPVPFAKGGDYSWALPLAGGATVGYATGSLRSVAVMAAAIADARGRQETALAKWGELSDVYIPQASVIAWNTMYTPYEGVVTPVSRGWDFGAGYVIFDWDNLFLSYMASLEEESLDIALSNLIQICLARTQDGFVPNFASASHVSYDRTEPQIGAFVTLQIYKKWGDARVGWVVDTVLDALLAWDDWVWRKRRGEGVLAGADGHADLIVLGSDPNAAPGGTVGGANDLQAARYESGLDNSPMYDGNDKCDGTEGPVCFDKNTTHHMSLYDVGMTGLFLSDTQALIELATARGRTDVLPTLQARFDRVAAATAAHLWDDATGAYTNVLYNGSFYARHSPTSFFPLISGQATPAQAQAAAAMAASPLGFCLTEGYAPHADAAMLVQWFKAHDNAPCVTDACTRDVVNAAYNFIRVEAVALLPTAGPAAGLVPLNLWFSASRGDYAMTNSSSPPDAAGGYEFVRQEAWCYSSPPSPTTGHAWGTTQLTSWYSASRNDYQVCGSPHCLVDTSSGYKLVGPLCFAFNGTGAENTPCKYGGNSIERSDPAFDDNNYWRGRIWGPHLQLIYWALAHPKYAAVPGIADARKALVAQGRVLLNQEWNLFRQITENYNGVIGVGEDVGNADPFYHWGALAGFLTFLENGAY